LNKFASKRRILIVGEGRETEYNYFVGFRNAFGKELEATATSVSVARGKGGDARGIVNNAIKEANKFEPNRDRGDRVFLLLDTEGVGRAPELPKAERLAKGKGIEIVYSCPAFEYWLLCHFQSAPRAEFRDCNAVITNLNKKWNTVCKVQYDKADQEVFDRLSHLVGHARVQALKIDRHHLGLTSTARRANPSTQVYELIAILIGVLTGEKCPIAGIWEPICDHEKTRDLKKSDKLNLEKGDIMPNHAGRSVRWKLDR
jgi:hypothetical protein